jgi:hypothetical protein
LAGFVVERLERRRAARIAVFACLGLVVGVAAYKTHAVVARPSPSQQIAEYQQIGEITRHTTRALYVDVRLRSPISYWGWMVGNYWYPPTPSQGPPPRRRPLSGVGRSHSRALPHRRSRRGRDRAAPARTFTRDLPLVGRTSHFAIFDVRVGRAVEPERRSWSAR